MKKGVVSGSGVGSGSISQRYGSGDPDPDPRQMSRIPNSPTLVSMVFNKLTDTLPITTGTHRDHVRQKYTILTPLPTPASRQQMMIYKFLLLVFEIGILKLAEIGNFKF